MSMTNERKLNDIVKATGLLVIEVVNSNPNGDPDRESDPRQRPDGRGEISPVSFKRKIRDLVENKEGPVWAEAARELGLRNDDRFQILESRGRDRAEIRRLNPEEFKDRYWDGRVFGNTFLEEDFSTAVKTGAVQFGLGVSLSPIQIERMTNTNLSGVQEGKDRGMAPLAYRIVQHGVYVMPFYVNPTAATKSGCSKQDIDLLCELIPYAYSHTASYVRPSVGIRRAWYIEHKSALGSCSDFAIIDSLRPKKVVDPDEPSRSWDEYDVPTGLPEELKGRVKSVRDLVTNQ
jgi:Cas7 group CRISPR-associated protein Csh2